MTVRGNCPHCGTKYVAFTIKESIQVLLSGRDVIRDTLAECGCCGRGVLMMQKGYMSGNDFHASRVAIAPSFPDTNAPPHTPENVANFFRQAMENMSGNYDAAGLMFRTTLETALKVKFCKSGETLNSLIKTAAKKRWLTSDMAEWSDEVRLGGNNAAHEIEPFSKEDAEKLKDFTNLLLYYMFTLPGMLKQAKERSKDKETQE